LSSAQREVDARGAPRARTLIVDDESLARRRLVAMLADEPAIHVIGEADGGSAAVRAIVDERPDLVFLDVQMPELDGFGVLRCTAGAHRPVVVFVTAYDEHAIRAFDVHAADYLLKPVTAARLREAVRRAVGRVENASRANDERAIDRLLSQVEAHSANVERIAIKQPDGTHFVHVGEITWVEADGDHLRVHVSRSSQGGIAAYTVRDTLANFAGMLQSFGFVRVHRSAIVNPNAISSVEPIAKGDYYLRLRDGARVRSGRRFRGAVQALAGR
jgi:two-component system, LytTR family, response regulator